MINVPVHFLLTFSISLRMNLDKTEKVTKDPKRVEAGLMDRKNLMKKMKENILNGAKSVGGDTIN